MTTRWPLQREFYKQTKMRSQSSIGDSMARVGTLSMSLAVRMRRFRPLIYRLIGTSQGSSSSRGWRSLRRSRITTPANKESLLWKKTSRRQTLSKSILWRKKPRVSQRCWRLTLLHKASKKYRLVLLVVPTRSSSKRRQKLRQSSSAKLKLSRILNISSALLTLLNMVLSQRTFPTSFARSCTRQSSWVNLSQISHWRTIRNRGRETS